MSGLMNGIGYASPNKSSINYLMDKFEKTFTIFKEEPEASNKLNLKEAKSLIEWGKRNGMISVSAAPQKKVYIPVEEININCKQCGIIFKGRRDRRFCGEKCANRFSQIRRTERNRAAIKKECVQCKRMFIMTRNAINCSSECCEIWERNRKREYKRLKRAERSAAKREAK